METVIKDGIAITHLNPKTGGGGTSDYSDLQNKPKINGVTLSGDKSAADLGLPSVHPYISLERLCKYLYRVTFDSLPQDNGGNAPVAGACSAYVQGGKLYRNFDFKYDNAAEFIVRTKGFEGMAMLTGLNDGQMDDTLIAQLPYRMVDGRNNEGIMVSVHLLFNDWEYTGAGSKSIPMTRLSFEVLSRVKSMATIGTDLADVLGNLNVTSGMGDYLLQCLITDGTTTYALIPPTTDGASYELVNATSYPKMSNFRYVARAEVSRNDMDLQDRPTGIERFNAMPCDLADLRFTKAYEASDRLSEFIGIDETTKSSTDAELEAIYELARAEYLVRQRDGKTWQTMHSVVYGKRMESLFIQENWDDNCVVVPQKQMGLAQGYLNDGVYYARKEWVPGGFDFEWSSEAEQHYMEFTNVYKIGDGVLYPSDMYGAAITTSQGNTYTIDESSFIRVNDAFFIIRAGNTTSYLATESTVDSFDNPVESGVYVPHNNWTESAIRIYKAGGPSHWEYSDPFPVSTGLIYYNVENGLSYRYDGSGYVENSEFVYGYYTGVAFFKTKNGTTYSDQVVPKVGFIYIDLDSNMEYRWDGSKYIKLSNDGGVVQGRMLLPGGWFFNDIIEYPEIVRAEWDGDTSGMTAYPEPYGSKTIYRVGNPVLSDSESFMCIYGEYTGSLYKVPLTSFDRFSFDIFSPTWRTVDAAYNFHEETIIDGTTYPAGLYFVYVDSASFTSKMYISAHTDNKDFVELEDNKLYIDRDSNLAYYRPHKRTDSIVKTRPFENTIDIFGPDASETRGTFSFGVFGISTINNKIEDLIGSTVYTEAGESGVVTESDIRNTSDPSSGQSYYDVIKFGAVLRLWMIPEDGRYSLVSQDMGAGGNTIIRVDCPEKVLEYYNASRPIAGAASWGTVAGDITSQSDLMSLVNGLKPEIVQELPAASSSTLGKIYLVPVYLKNGATRFDGWFTEYTEGGTVSYVVEGVPIEVSAIRPYGKVTYNISSHRSRFVLRGEADSDGYRNAYNDNGTPVIIQEGLNFYDAKCKIINGTVCVNSDDMTFTPDSITTVEETSYHWRSVGASESEMSTKSDIATVKTSLPGRLDPNTRYVLDWTNDITQKSIILPPLSEDERLEFELVIKTGATVPTVQWPALLKNTPVLSPSKIHEINIVRDYYNIIAVMAVYDI